MKKTRVLLFPVILVGVLCVIIVLLVIHGFQLDQIEANLNQKMTKNNILNDVNTEPNQKIDQRLPIGYKIGQNINDESINEKS